jgi:hypothetical protein
MRVRHADEDAARDAALLQVAIDRDGSALDTIIDVEKIGYRRYPRV